MCYLVIFELGERLRCEDKPVVPGSSLHNAQVVDGHVALADHLVAKLATGLLSILSGALGAATKDSVFQVFERNQG